MTHPRKLAYNNSRNREYQVFHQYEKQGYYAIRPAGSHGIADVIALRPATCGDPSHFEVVFEQIKTSQNTKQEKTEMKVEDSACGPINVLWHYFPVKNEAWKKGQKIRKIKEKLRKLKARK